MPILSALFAPVVLLASTWGGGHAAPADLANAPQTPAEMSDHAADWLGLEKLRTVDTAQQVRIESRVILRIVPRPAPSRDEMMSRFAPTQVRIVERNARQCLAMRDIAGVSDRGDRLLLFLRDSRVMVPILDKTCSPRDFYRGFYLEKSDDGMLCAGRDRLLARSGASCQVAAMRELVQIVERR